MTPIEQDHSKVTVQMDRDLYLRLSKALHHGQMSAIVRAFLTQVDQILQEKGPLPVTNWLYGGKQLLLEDTHAKKKRKG